MPGCMQPGAQYSQKPGLYPPSEQFQQQGPDSKQLDDLGLDLSKQGKRWFPFSDGPRNCVGQALAKLNMAATFAQLYSHYSFQLAEEVTSLGWGTLQHGICNLTAMHISTFCMSAQVDFSLCDC